MNRLMTLEEITSYLQVGRGTVYNWIKYKGFPRRKCGRLLRFDLSDVDSWVAQQTLTADRDIRALRDAHPHLGRHDPSQPVEFTLD